MNKVFLIAAISIAALFPANALASPEEDLVRSSIEWVEAQGFAVGGDVKISFHQNTSTFEAEYGNPFFGDVKAFSAPDVIAFSPETSSAIKWLIARPKGKPFGKLATRYATLILHEILHRAGHRAYYDSAATAHERRLEEGITEQVARDLTPAYVYKFFKYRMKKPVTTGPYEEYAKAIRTTSVVFSGSGKWTDRASRIWRKNFMNSDLAGRRAML